MTDATQDKADKMRSDSEIVAVLNRWSAIEITTDQCIAELRLAIGPDALATAPAAGAPVEDDEAVGVVIERDGKRGTFVVDVAFGFTPQVGEKVYLAPQPAAISGSLEAVQRDAKPLDENMRVFGFYKQPGE